jgi:hypothetical protein
MIGLSTQAIQVLMVTAPMFALLGAAIIFLLLLRKRDGELEVFELGVFYAGVVFIYSVYPLMAYVTGGLQFSRFSNFRLFVAQPLPGQMAIVAWYFFIYFVCFLAAYLLVRGSCKLEKIRIPRPDPRMLLVLVLLYAATKLFFLFVTLYYDIPRPESYTSSYLLYANLPLIVQQLANHLGGIELTLQVILIAYLTLNYQRYKYIIFGWISLELVALFFYGIGARTGLFILLGSLLVTYHFAVKHLKVRYAVVVGLVALSLFTLLGLLRDSPMFYADSPKNPLAYDSEFESVFATSYDLLFRKGTGQITELLPSLYVIDFLNLAPQQFLPIRKIDPSSWYVESYYPAFALSGGGLAFGAIPEAIAGVGWIDAAWRGSIIGVIFALLHRNFIRGRKSFWKYCFYVWMIVFSYQSFRQTTFRLLPRFFYEFLSVFIVACVMVLLFPVQREVGARIRSRLRSTNCRSTRANDLIKRGGLPRRLLQKNHPLLEE